uniref:Insulin-like domain-containing protein n=1 Tax=Angiostrongylus cantonensis TaxID=6313 RepID=A0A0K0DIA5_ANGCA
MCSHFELTASNNRTLFSDGRLRMCPPGGSSFTMAWSMACTMRRKRQVTYKNSFPKRALIAPSIRQLQIICCDVGCSVNDLMSYCGQLTGW